MDIRKPKRLKRRTFVVTVEAEDEEISIMSNPGFISAISEALAAYLRTTSATGYISINVDERKPRVKS